MMLSGVGIQLTKQGKLTHLLVDLKCLPYLAFGPILSKNPGNILLQWQGSKMS